MLRPNPPLGCGCNTTNPKTIFKRFKFAHAVVCMQILADHSFKGNLIKPHQPAGVEWMFQKELCNPAGGILCDDMGMGKTIQCLALICKSPKKTLIVVPKSLLTQWKDAIEQNTNLPYSIYHKQKYNDDVIITLCTYNNVLNLHCKLHTQNWGRIVLDEGHIIRNRKTKMFSSVCLSLIHI